MRLSCLVALSALVLPALAHAQGRPQTVIVTPSYPPAYASPYASPYAQPYSGVLGIPGVSSFSGGVAAGAYPSGAQTCVAADQACPASAPNTVGNHCTCPGRDGRPVPGAVH